MSNTFAILKIRMGGILRLPQEKEEIIDRVNKFGVVTGDH